MDRAIELVKARAEEMGAIQDGSNRHEEAKYILLLLRTERADMILTNDEAEALDDFPQGTVLVDGDDYFWLMGAGSWYCSNGEEFRSATAILRDVGIKRVAFVPGGGVD